MTQELRLDAARVASLAALEISKKWWAILKLQIVELRFQGHSNMTEQPFSKDDFERQLEQFDQAWQENAPPAIDDFLPGLDALTLAGFGRHELLVELIMIDLECRWRRQLPSASSTANVPHVGDESIGDSLPEKPLLEDYLKRYPDLGSVADLSIELVAQVLIIPTSYRFTMSAVRTIFLALSSQSSLTNGLRVATQQRGRTSRLGCHRARHYQPERNGGSAAARARRRRRRQPCQEPVPVEHEP